jgi:hypothetical protein
MRSVKELCQHLSELAKSAGTINETINIFYVNGDFSDNVKSIIKKMICLSDSNKYEQWFTLNVDSQSVSFSDFDDYFKLNQHPAEFELTVQKKELIQCLYSGCGDVDEILYTSVEAFQSEHNGLGLKKPLLEGAINKASNTRIHVFGLEHAFGGPRLSVIPLESNEPNADWLSGSKLPASEVIHKQVHVVSNDNIIINPQAFELSWGAVESEYSRLFRFAYAKHLLVALCTNYYSDEKVELKGVKHIQANIVSDSLTIEADMVSALAECIKWCYDKENPDVPIQLLIDRLCLECASENLLQLTSKVLQQSLEQAKNNYRFVIAKRSDEYRKELKDIYADIQKVTDKFADKTLSLASELLKSLLTIGFMFTVGTISKAIVNNKLLHSPEGQLLFKVVGVFLAFSFFIRWLNASADLKISEKALRSWSVKLHSHISNDDVDKLIKEQTSWSKWFYRFSLAIVTAIQLSVAYAAYHSSDTLLILGL